MMTNRLTERAHRMRGLRDLVLLTFSGSLLDFLTIFKINIKIIGQGRQSVVVSNGSIGDGKVLSRLNIRWEGPTR